MKYRFVFLFIITYLFFDNSIGYTTHSPIWTHFTYMFQHAGIVHLIINSLAFIGMFRVLEKYLNKWLLVETCILIAFLGSFVSGHNIPTVGASAMIYAMTGMYCTICLQRIKYLDKRKFFSFAAMIFISLLVSFFKSNSNFYLHLYSFIMGILFYWLIGIIHPNSHAPAG